MKTSTKYLKLLVNLIIFVAGILTIVFIIPKLIVFFLPFVIGWIIAMIANPLVRILEKRVKILRKHSSMLIIIGVIAIIVIGFYFAAAKIGGEVVSFIGNLPELYESASSDFEEIGESIDKLAKRLPPNIGEGLEELQYSIGTYIGKIVGMAGKPTVEAAGNFAKNLPSRLISVIMTVLSSYFFIKDRDRIMEFFEAITPESIKRNVGAIINDFKSVVGGYFKAQFKIMFVVAIILLVGLSILRVDYAVVLALLIALLDFLPFFGTGTVLIPWAVIKVLSNDYKFAVGLLVVYAVSQLVRQLIQPKIVGDTIGLDPLFTLIFMYIGYKIKGVIGMIIGVPIGMIVINLYKNGAFDRIIRYIRIVIDDINEFRKL